MNSNFIIGAVIAVCALAAAPGSTRLRRGTCERQRRRRQPLPDAAAQIAEEVPSEAPFEGTSRSVNTHHKPSMAVTLVTLLAGLTSVPASAESIYKSTLPDGRVIYGSRPEKAAAKVQKLEPSAPIVEVEAEAARAQREREKAQAIELETRLAARRSAWERADAAVIDAEDALADAEKALLLGTEPLPGERVGTVDGGSRLSEAHFDRMRSLENEVRAAKRQLDKARRERNDVD